MFAIDERRVMLMVKEKSTDFYIAQQLQSAGIPFEYQESSNCEIQSALKSASKRQTGKHGFPEYVSVVNDYVIVIEDKTDTDKHILHDVETKEIDLSIAATTEYAVNGALWYAMCIARQTGFSKVFAIGASGSEKHHKISPVFVDGTRKTPVYTELDEIETFANFTPEHIDNYYNYAVMGLTPDEELELEDILKYAGELHEALRNYANLGEAEKPLVVSAILLALQEKSFHVEELRGDSVKTDGMVIYEALQNHLKRIQVTPDTKREKILNQFLLIRDRTSLNSVRSDLGKTPLKYYAQFLEKNIMRALQANVREDILGRFYSEFVSYSGGDGQSLGVVLTPRHVTELFCDLLQVSPTDTIFDPCTGTAGFLISSMHHMLSEAVSEQQRRQIKKNQIFGIEIREDMFAIATTNMILRGDGKSNLRCADFLKEDAEELQVSVGATVGMMNPPYSQNKGKGTEHLAEICFIEHLLNSLAPSARAAVIVPQSTAIGKTVQDRKVKERILKNHTLEGTITLNTNTFYRVGTNPCIMVFTCHERHPENKLSKFVNFENDGFEVRKHIGLVETEAAEDKRQYLLDCWFGKTQAPSGFMVEAIVKPNDEWLHSFFYFNDVIPSEEDFEKSIADYLTFEFGMVMQGREDLFQEAASA